MNHTHSTQRSLLLRRRKTRDRWNLQKRVNRAGREDVCVCVFVYERTRCMPICLLACLPPSLSLVCVCNGVLHTQLLLLLAPGLSGESGASREMISPHPPFPLLCVRNTWVKFHPHPCTNERERGHEPGGKGATRSPRKTSSSRAARCQQQHPVAATTATATPSAAAATGAVTSSGRDISPHKGKTHKKSVLGLGVRQKKGGKKKREGKIAHALLCLPLVDYGDVNSIRSSCCSSNCVCVCASKQKRP